jgi:hypothetical protein
MLVYVTAHATNYPQVSWVSEYPHNPYTDYATYGTLPHASLLGAYSIVRLPQDSIDQIWAANRTSSGITSVYLNLGADLVAVQWSREVDNQTNVVLTLSNDNTSSSWARINETDIAPRRQL